MLTILCIMWVMNLSLACSETNKTWWFNLLAALYITVTFVEVLAGTITL